ncbi:MAG: rhodanese-like domain-containing protein [Gammaproteobacteria bacterium]|nr:rhodanese-like domain-containing protein [Gammaproteobacteria bacterium]
MKKTLKATLLSLSVASAAACSPSAKYDVSLIDVAQAAAREDDRVSAHELATWLIEGRGDFKLIDVRTPADFENGSIGDAENIPIAQIVSDETLARLPGNRMLLMYSNGSENAAKAAVMLRLAGFDAHLLVGGYTGWHEQILNPDISSEALDGESLQVSEQRAYACYFVGERSDTAELPASKPFVPPVFDETEELEDLPPPAEEGC